MELLFTICDSDGVFICDRITRAELNTLRGIRRNAESGMLETAFDEFGSPLRIFVTARKRKPHLWVSLVAVAEIKAEIRKIRGIAEIPEISALSSAATGYWETLSTDRVNCRVFVINQRVSLGFRTTANCAREHSSRLMYRRLAVAA